jgi:flagellar hook assembly protein FlgD
VPSPPGVFVLRVVPNPVRTRATISLRNLSGAPAPALSRLEIADAAGRIVRTLLPAAGFPARESIEWDGRDDSGRALASGVYFVSAEEHARGRLVLVR